MHLITMALHLMLMEQVLMLLHEDECDPLNFY
jgi:hypothetical protein